MRNLTEQERDNLGGTFDVVFFLGLTAAIMFAFTKDKTYQGIAVFFLFTMLGILAVETIDSYKKS